MSKINKYSPFLDRISDDKYCHMGGGSGGGSGGITGNIYSPSAQPQMDTNWQQILGNLQGQYSEGKSPGQRWAPWAEYAGQLSVDNSYQGDAVRTSKDAANLQLGMLPNLLTSANELFNLGTTASNYAPATLAQGWNQNYQDAQNIGQGLEGYQAQQIPALFQAGMQDLQTGNDPWVASQLRDAGNRDLQAGYDPRQALYNRTQSQVADQTNAQLANQGLAGSPYGASVAGNTMSNFNIDWQNQQLQRQLAGGAGAAQMYGAEQQRQLAGGQGAASMFGAEAQQGDTMLRNLITPANAMGNAQAQAAQTYGNLGQSLQAGAQGSNALNNSALQQLATYGALPYQTQQSIYGNDFSAIQNAINLGNAQYQLPQQLMGNLQSYMQLGQSANNLGAQNALAANAQMMQGLSGLGSLAGGLNNWGTSGSGGFLGELFGGSAGAGADYGSIGYGMDAAAGAGSAASGGGGIGLESLLSLAAS